MTKKLEELFDLPSNDEFAKEVSDDNNFDIPVTQEALDSLEKIESALPAVKGLEASDKEMDDLAKKASDSFDDLMDLGMQVDSRYASEIFSVASTMLGHAITAKNAKLNKKLKMIELQLKKAKLDHDLSGDEPTATGTGMVLDRNQLLDRLINRDQTKKPE